MSLYG